MIHFINKLQSLIFTQVLIILFLFGCTKVNGQSIYWGAWIAGNTYGLSGNAPWNTQAWDTFESHTVKKISILHWNQPWYSSVGWPQNYYPFVPGLMDTTRNRGAIPMISWGSEDIGKSDQSNYALRKIIDGTHDTYIKNFASAAKAWGKPFFLRFNHEMNGSWFPWGYNTNGNQAGEFIQAWRRVHDLFTLAGADNVTWVWCPNVEYPGSAPFFEMYPGNEYVDWLCLDGYNWGTGNAGHPDIWKSFNTLYQSSYNTLIQMAPGKPIIVGETATSEIGGSKAAWITDVLSTQLSNNYPQIKGFVWFNKNDEGADWVIETSSQSQSAFASGIASSRYAANTFSLYTQSPISPIGGTIADRSPYEDVRVLLKYYFDLYDSIFVPDGKINSMDVARAMVH